jgi:hypothetical protein
LPRRTGLVLWACDASTTRRGVNDGEGVEAGGQEAWARARAAKEQQWAAPSGPTREDWLWWLIRETLRRVNWRALLGGIYRRGVANALDIRLNRIEFAFDDLPAPFDGYTILHITDMHFERLPATAERLIAILGGVRADLCALTGDYGVWWKKDLDHVLGPMRGIVAAVEAADGFIATLGNHDSLRLIEPMGRLGVRVLVNETLSIARGGAQVHVTPSYFFSRFLIK